MLCTDPKEMVHDRVGGALGIAMGGSILAGSYGEQIAGTLGLFPEPVRGPASDSLAEALAVANQLGPQGQQLADVSKAAFNTAIDSSFLVMADIIGVAALVIQFPAVRRFRERLSK